MPAQPAQPLLASTLFSLYKARHHDNNHANINHQTSTSEVHVTRRKRRKLETGWKGIDAEVLQGGLDYGEGGIVCFSAGGSGTGNEADAGVAGLGDELAYSTIASHLLSTTSSSPSHATPATARNPAFYIDTLGTFDPRRLHTLLCTRLRQPDFTHQGGYVYHKVNGLVGMTRTSNVGGGTEEESVEEKAARLLDRVKIMRCFDFSGLMECIGEVGTLVRELEREIGHEVREGGGSDFVEQGRAAYTNTAVDGARDEAAKSLVSKDQTGTKTQLQAQRLEILDSQADDFDDDDDLLLDDYLVNLPDTAGLIDNAHVPPPPIAEALQPLSSNHRHQQPPKPQPPQTLLILPSLPRLLSPLMHSNHIRGHALLTHLLRSLRHLTSSHALCVLILNSVVGVPNPNAYTKQNVDEGISVFGENGGMRPALGKTFAWGVDLGLMGSFVGAAGGGGGRRVVEVVSDRFGGRVGRWGVVE